MGSLSTARLILREWLPEDVEPFAKMNQDEAVMQYFPAILSQEESKKFIEKVNKHFEQHGFGLYAVELKKANQFIGFVGLNVPDFKAHFTPCVEIGWRLASEHWGQGYATEAAKKVLDHAFNDLKLEEVVAFTVPANQRSIRIMQKLGMHHDPANDFYHPSLPQDHPLSKHVLYRLLADRWVTF